jgi:microsomal epoxide hydrolase
LNFPLRAVTTARRALIASAVALCLLPVSAGASAGTVSRYFNSSDGVQLHYLEAGQGRTLVFVPGWTMPAEIWRPQIEHFSSRYRVIAFDPRGQGRSAIPKSGYTAERRALDIKELLECFPGESVVLIGWSLGVLESLAYVRAHGEARLSALVLVDNSIGEEPPPGSDPTFFERLRKNRTATVEKFVRGMYKTPQTSAYLKNISAQAQRMPLDASIALLSYPFPREFWRETVYGVHQPVLYAVSARFRGQAQNLERKHPQARIAVFDGAGHALFVDEAPRFNKLLDDFLAREVTNKNNRHP